MNRIHVLAPVMLVALSLASPLTNPTLAAQRGPRDRGSQDRDSRDRANGNDRGAGRVGGGGREAPREPGARQRPVSPVVGVAVPRTTPRVIEPRRPEPRAFAPRTPGPRRFAPRAVEPRYVRPRLIVPRYVEPRVIVPRVVVGPRPHYRPYYTFQPRFSLGFGLFIGHPVAYPYSHYPYAYQIPVQVPRPTGGLSFEITPSDAALYIDGRYMGLVDDFSPTMQPLSLAPGRHRIEIVEVGYEPMVFDVDVIAGQVIPFQGAMEPQ